MKGLVYLNVEILCGECCSIMSPMPEYIPRRIVFCTNEKCSGFNIALEIKPIELDIVVAEDILR